MLFWIQVALAALAAAYGLHRFLLYLERRDWRSPWRDAPRGGGYNPLMEIYHPQIRHVVQAHEQRLGDEEDDSGAPPNPPSPPNP
jgi:hypothetical protein